MRARTRVAVVFVLAMLVAGAFLLRPYARGLAFVARASDRHGAVRLVANAGARRVTVRSIELNTGTDTKAAVAARLYRPDGAPRRLALLVSGLHPQGIDEPRLVSLANELAASGLAVVTPDIPELSRFDIVPRLTDAIEAAALSAADLAKAESAGDGRIGLMGIGFSGGLAVVAAGRPSLADRIAFVLSTGGHDDFPRVLRYLCTGVEPAPTPELRIEARNSGSNLPPSGDGPSIVLLITAERLVPARQVGALRDAVRRFLVATALTRTDTARAAEEFAAIKKLVLPEPSATLLRYVNERDVAHLGARLLPYVGAYGAPAALSPTRSPKPRAPVFLLHGVDDNVIPAIESDYLAAELRGRTPAQVLLTPLVGDADVLRTPGAGEALQMAGFWGELLAR